METEKEDQEAFRDAVLADKKRGVSRKSPYTIGFTGQVKALTIRQCLQDRFQLTTSFGMDIVCLFVRARFDSDCIYRFWRLLLALPS